MKKDNTNLMVLITFSVIVIISLSINFIYTENILYLLITNILSYLFLFLLILFIYIRNIKIQKRNHILFQEKCNKLKREKMKYKNMTNEFKQEFYNKDYIWEKKIIDVKKEMEKLEQDAFTKSLEFDQLKNELKEKLKKEEVLNQEIFKIKLEIEQLKLELSDQKVN